uniref:CC domain-containing protein n=1 Tax=Panagrolaimus sp. PS1159 TaxID=55785 RepID=A0AC35FAT1_9BILA
MSSSKVALCAFILIISAVCVLTFDKKSAVGPCILGRCQPGHVCSNGECFPKMKDYKAGGVDSDVKASNVIGPCVNGLCPKGHECVSNKCYKSTKRSASVAIGPCIGGDCPSGYTCNKVENQCYA